MTDFTGKLALAQDETFKGKVEMAAVISAVNIMAEAQSRGFETYQAKRRKLAGEVLGNSVEPNPMIPVIPRDQGALFSRFAVAIASAPAIDMSSTDDDIQFTVNSMWDALAGVDPDEKP